MKEILKSKLNPLIASVVPHIETSQLICIANQLTGFYMRVRLAINGFMEFLHARHNANSRGKADMHCLQLHEKSVIDLTLYFLDFTFIFYYHSS